MPDPREAFDAATAAGDAQIAYLLDGEAPPGRMFADGQAPVAPAAPAAPVDPAAPAASSPSWLSGIGRALKGLADGVSSLEFRAPAQPRPVVAGEAAPPPTPWGWILGGLAALLILVALRRS